jgi:hypothetical protein
MTQAIRSTQGLPMTPQPGKMYSKSRTSLAERTIQTVRAQGKCLVAFLEGKMQMKIPEDHVLRGWAMVHVGWLLNRCHLTSGNGVTAYMAVRGRRYKGRVCAFGEEVYTLDSLRKTYQCQWRRGCWMTKDEADHDIVVVGSREVLRSKTVRKKSEHWDAAMLISMEVGPWDLRRGTQTILKLSKPLAQPLPRLHGAEGEVEPERDVDEEAMIKYAKDHPDDDKEEAGEPLLPPQEPQAVDNKLPEIPDAEFEGMIAEAAKRDREQELALPMASKQRVADPEGVKKPTGNQLSTQAKFVKFDHTKTEEQKAKHSRTGGMFNPTFAGDLISSPAAATSSPSTTTGHVRRITEEIELYDEDEIEEKIPLETWDWDVNDQLLDGDFSEHEISEVDKAKRGFHNENAGPPQVSAEELAYLDKQAMYAELERLRQLEVISDVQAGLDVP